MLIRFLSCTLLSFLMLFNITPVKAANHCYILWEGLEPDKCGVSWLIKTFVDREAVFKFVKKGTIVSGGIPIDTPDSKIQRRQNLSAFEVALQEYKIDDPILKRIGKIIWDIEINKWEKKVTQESAGLNVILYGLIKKETNLQKALEKSIIIYDALYKGLKNN